MNFTSVLNAMLHPGQTPLTWPKHRHRPILETTVCLCQKTTCSTPWVSSGLCTRPTAVSSASMTIKQ